MGVKGELGGNVSEFKNEPVIDYDTALENAAGDREIFLAVCESALQEIPSLYPGLIKAIDQGQLQEAQRLAHTIKGAARVIAAVKTMKIAEKIESDMGKQDAQSARSSLSDLADAIDELKQELND